MRPLSRLIKIRHSAAAAGSTVSGSTVSGHVIDLGSIPQQSAGSGKFEAEGVDYDPAAGILRVEMVQPGICEVATTVYEYRAS